MKPRKLLYPIGPVYALNINRNHKIILAVALLWAFISTVFTVLVVKENFGLRSCHIEQLSVVEPRVENLDAVRSEKHQMLAERIHKLYRVPLAEAKNIVTAVAMSADKVFTAPLILSIIATESSFKKHAESETGAVGYMQLTLASGRRISLNVYSNLHEGTQLLKDYYSQLGSIEAAIEAYTVGITAYKSGRRAPEYLSKVLENAKKFEQI